MTMTLSPSALTPQAVSLRPIIADSWRRSAISGIDPEVLITELPVEEFDRRSRLLAAAAPVLEELAEGLSHTSFCLLLADSTAQLVDMRCGQHLLQDKMEETGAALGRRLTEQSAGTNSVGTCFELRAPVAVRGEEHFVEGLKRYSCYGIPLINPLNRRFEGVLDITCLSEQDTPLLAPFITMGAKAIMSELVNSARASERRMWEAYQQMTVARRECPVLVFGEDVLVSNPAAVDMLSHADHALLRDLAADVSADTSVSKHMALSSGSNVDVKVSRIPGGGGGVLCVLEPASPIQQIRVFDGTARAGDSTEDATVARFRRNRTSTLVTGEPGSGRTTTLTVLAGSEPLAIVDAGSIMDQGVASWIRDVADLVEHHKGLIGIEAIHVLPNGAARRLSQVLSQGTAWVAFTCNPLDELGGDAQSLALTCPGRLELRPLRSRRDEIPVIIESLLHSINPESKIRFTTTTLGVLMNQQWDGNLRELEMVVRYAAERRHVGDITPRDLPTAHQGSSRSRRLTRLEQAEHDEIVKALRIHGGNKLRAAEHLGISRTTLYKSIRSLGIVL